MPDARFDIGHGQMSEDDLERVMYDFYHHKFDILVCTTIIENGLDVSNANTILSTMPTIWACRSSTNCAGASGASSRQAYGYLFYRRHKQLSEVAERRLAAMKEFSALGSGYKVAMRDMEIRGAGNLLGAEQHGAMVSVGFDLYFQLLSQAVQEVKGEEVTEDILPPVDLPVTAHIPNEYIPGEAERIYFYKRMSGVRVRSPMSRTCRPSWRTGSAIRRARSGRPLRSCACACAARRSASPPSRARERTSTSGSRRPSA